MSFRLLAVLVGLCWLPAGLASEFRAGTARVDITPPVGFPLWGYAARRDAPSTGVRDRLQARALVLQQGNTSLALVALDLGRAPTRDSSARIRERVRKEGKIDSVFLVASHTHHGPVLEDTSWPTPKTSYVRDLEDRLVRLILEASKAARPARLGVVQRTSQLNRNRHSRLAEKPVDRDLLVLRVEDLEGKAIAHAVNFAAHPTILPAKLMDFSADWPGVLCQQVEKASGVPCLFLQGAAGDLSPNTSNGRNTPERFGTALAEEVLACLREVRCEVPGNKLLRWQREEFAFAARVDLKNPLWKVTLAAAFYPALIAYYEREYASGVRPELTTALLDGRIGFVGVSGEVFSAHALHLKRRARLDHLFFLGYCNDYHQYFPTIEAFAEGGYGTEVYIGTAEIGSGERLMDRALQTLYRQRGQIR